MVNISTTQKVEQTAEGEQHPGFQFPEGSPFRDFFDQFNRRRGDRAPRQANSLGSGFIVDSTGYVVTNNHVIEGGEEITVIMHDGEEYKA